jgi:endonuclease/exonuclease/phosphatase family metal-dependent hydrolase
VNKRSCHIMPILGTALLVACTEPGEPIPDLDEELSGGEVAGAPSGARVMTQNMYVGLDVLPLAFTSFEDLPFAAATAFENFEANRPFDRIVRIAEEIALTQPDLVALQEVTRIYEQFPSDTMTGNFVPNATDDVIDYLAVLLWDLAVLGVPYEVALEQPGADIELPRFDGEVDGAPVFSDVRAKFSDVILRRRGVQTTPLFGINYTARLPFPPIPGAVVPRNAVAVTAQLNGETVRVVSTHLEVIIDILPPEAQPQFAQVAELITALNGIAPDLPTIVLGDFNSPAPGGPTYQQMTGAGFTDVWTRAGTAVPGLTCCQAEVLTNPESQLFERIDFVWTKNITLHEPVVAFTIGDSDTFRTATEPRLWPSDHAGVVAPLRF